MRGRIEASFHMSSWHSSLHSSVHPLRNASDTRLPTVAVSRLLSVFWDDDYRSQRDAERVSSVLPSPACYRGWLCPIILWVTARQSPINRSLDSADGTVTVMSKVLHTMTQALLQSPDFGLYEDISPPFGLLLFYLFNFIVSVCTYPQDTTANESALEHPRGSIQPGLFRCNR
jgi:hypothetical protein